MGGPLQKYDFSGIGSASAVMVLTALAANPGTAFLTTGLSGKIVAWILTKFFSSLASMGLVVLNIGASRVETLVDGKRFDGSWDTAEELIAAIRSSGREMTPEEVKAIDDPVIAAFRKWASFARKK